MEQMFVVKSEEREASGLARYIAEQDELLASANLTRDDFPGLKAVAQEDGLVIVAADKPASFVQDVWPINLAWSLYTNSDPGLYEYGFIPVRD